MFEARYQKMPAERDGPSPHQRPDKGKAERLQSLSTSSSSDSSSSSEAENEKEKKERATQLASLKTRVGANMQAYLQMAAFSVY